MRTYILFIFGSFDDYEEVSYFCMEVLGSSKNILSLKYVIDTSKSIVAIFDSNSDEERLKDELSEILNNENVTLYFMFKKENLMLSYIPQDVKNLIFKPTSDSLNFEISIQTPNHVYNLDEILDKIETSGIESLTPEEKKFLDDFNL